MICSSVRSLVTGQRTDKKLLTPKQESDIKKYTLGTNNDILKLIFQDYISKVFFLLFF